MVELNKIDEVLDILDATAEELFTDPFEVEEVFQFLQAGIAVAQEVVPNLAYEDGKALLLAVWEHYSAEYGLVEKIDKALDFNKIIPVIGLLIEQWDAKAIEALVEQLAIPAIAGVLFKKSA